MKEQWVPIPGFEGLYEVSDLGRVKSVARVVPHKSFPQGMSVRERVMKPSPRPDGHLQIKLAKSGASWTFKVHRLVLQAFVGEPPMGMEGCHNDGVPSNNALSNLRWDTRSENTIDRVRHGKHHMAAKKACPRGHLLEAPNLRPDTLRVGNRGCLACQRTYGICSWRKIPFDQEMADLYYEGIMEHGEGYSLPRKRKEVCELGHLRTPPNLTSRGDQCLACARTYHYCRYHKLEFNRNMANERYKKIMREVKS